MTRRIKEELQDKPLLGNLDSKRDAPDEDDATGESYSAREMVELAFDALGDFIH